MARVGFLYTIGLLLMTLTVLSLALFIAQVEKKSNERVADLAKFDRLYDLQVSINNGFAEIFKVSSGISLRYGNLTNHTLFIRENLPNNNYTGFGMNMTNFAIYLNKTSNSATDNVTIYKNNFIALRENLPLRITPYNITYNHAPDFNPTNTRTISAKSSGNKLVRGYNITIYSPNEVLAAPTIRGTTGSSNLRVALRVFDPTNPGLTPQVTYLDRDRNRYFMIRNAANTAWLINITFNQSSVFINNIQGSKLIVDTGIMFWMNSTELTSVSYPRKIYNVTIPALEVKRMVIPVVEVFRN